MKYSKRNNYSKKLAQHSNKTIIQYKHKKKLKKIPSEYAVICKKNFAYSIREDNENKPI